MRYVIVILVILLASCNNNYDTAEAIRVDSIGVKMDSISSKYEESIQQIDSITPIVDMAISKLRHYEQLKSEYENKLSQMGDVPIAMNKVGVDTATDDLRRKLVAANSEISRLKGEVAYLRRPKDSPTATQEVSAYFTQPKIEVPDDNSIVLTMDGKSKRGDISTHNLTIYLIPFSKRAKKYMTYEASCDIGPEVYGAKYYNGLYFFNSVPPGKYLIKVCTYYGGYKVIDKPNGKYVTSMQVAPPIQ